jgi:hypothetical protein
LLECRLVGSGALISRRIGRLTARSGLWTCGLRVGSSLLWSMKAPPVVAGVSVFGGAGYLVSLYLGWRLLRAIEKSGDINSKK